ncbi:hypothetical protein KC220_25185, partial [Mycobacterium tuberculosis]|nr:hypothetical protein [Mycobacterium tuberculosis]
DNRLAATKLQSFVTLVSQFVRIGAHMLYSRKTALVIIAHDNNAVEKVTKRNIILRFVTQLHPAFAYNKS